MGKLAVVDTADVFIKNKATGKVFLTAEAQLTGIAQSLGINESIFGGIGSKKLFTFKGQKEVTATIRNALYDKEFLAMTQGVEVLEGETVLVHKTENNLAVNNGTVIITGEPVEDIVYVRNEDGETIEAPYTTSSIELPEGFARVNSTVSVTYQAEVTGDVVKLDADKFGSSYEVEYRTIGYDTVTDEVKVDIYIKLFNVSPQGEFDFALENGTALAPEFTFDAKAVGDEIGEIIEVPRNNGATP